MHRGYSLVAGTPEACAAGVPMHPACSLERGFLDDIVLYLPEAGHGIVVCLRLQGGRPAEPAWECCLPPPDANRPPPPRAVGSA